MSSGVSRSIGSAPDTGAGGTCCNSLFVGTVREILGSFLYSTEQSWPTILKNLQKFSFFIKKNLKFGGETCL